MKKKALIIRYGAYGDIIHCSMLPRILSEEGYDVTFEYNWKGLQLLAHNPYIKKHIFYEPSADKKLIDNVKDIDKLLKERWAKISKGYDKVINLHKSLEYGTMAMEGTKDILLSKAERKKKFDNNYYDWTLKWSGYKNLCGKGIKGEIYYSKEEEKKCENHLKTLIENNIPEGISKGFFPKVYPKTSFVLVVNLSGTGLHKVYPHIKKVINEFISFSQSILVITTGDKHCQVLEWENERLVNLSGRIPFRQALLLTKYADAVIGCESGLLVGANMWGTRTCQLMTAASIKCHNHPNSKNNYSLQSTAECSPCFSGHYKYENCKIDTKYNLPICVLGFSPKDVFVVLKRMLYDWYDNGVKKVLSTKI